MGDLVHRPVSDARLFQYPMCILTNFQSAYKLKERMEVTKKEGPVSVK